MAWRNVISFCSFGSSIQGREGEAHHRCGHTVKSHGAKVARSHKHDWLILLLLITLEVILNVIHPFYRFVGKDMLTDLKYPMKDNTVPVWAVPLYAVLLPIAIFVVIYLRRRDVYDLHHSILGLLFSVLITGVITDAIKDATGRPRPDFFWRCFPDGVDVLTHSFMKFHLHAYAMDYIPRSLNLSICNMKYIAVFFFLIFHLTKYA